MQDEVRYKLLNLLDKNPKVTQRELADQLGVSVGKTNYCMAALIDKVRGGTFKKGETVVFLHTGGQAALHAYRSTFASSGICPLRSLGR